MATEKELQALEETKASLTRMQEFDVSSLSRETELGQLLNFSPVINSANRIVDLFKRLTIVALEDFPQNSLNTIKQQADNNYNLFNQILEFNPTQENAANERTNFINQIESSYQPTFQNIHPFISFSLHRSADFQKLDREARATFQGIKDQANTITEELSQSKEEAKRILKEIQQVSAEQGVTQQAIYFKEASQEHEDQSNEWKKITIWVAVGLAVYAILTLFIHKIPWLTPKTIYETVQMAISKILIFAVILYVLYLSARNFLSHKHNAIINKHRQNALMTYKAIVEAAGNTPNREIILNHAAACIFTPQCTWYSSDSAAQTPPATSVVELLSKTISENA